MVTTVSFLLREIQIIVAVQPFYQLQILISFQTIYLAGRFTYQYQSDELAKRGFFCSIFYTTHGKI